MPYDADRDKVLKEWKSGDTGLVVSIRQYGESDPKVQIGPRILKKQDGSDRAPVKAGRLSMEDVLWLYGIIDDVKDALSEVAKPA